MYKSTKKYDHNLGISSAFRQWRAKSHCKYLHSYSLAFEFTFATHELDETNWVVDFGGLSPLKKILVDTFDHKTIVAQDDPEMEWYKEGHERGIMDLIILPGTGCELFSKYAYDKANEWFQTTHFSPRCWIESVKVAEHSANSATYTVNNI